MYPSMYVQYEKMPDSKVSKHDPSFQSFWYVDEVRLVVRIKKIGLLTFLYGYIGTKCQNSPQK